jgi:hypothetical protein
MSIMLLFFDRLNLWSQIILIFLLNNLSFQILFFIQKLMHDIYTFAIEHVPQLAFEFSPLGCDA